MRVVHVPFCYWPDPVGGTEIYVQSLAKAQQRLGIDAMVAAPASRDGSYTREGIAVHRFEVAQQVTDVGQLYGEGDVGAARSFGRILDEQRPDLVHLHAFTRGVSLRLVREAKVRDLPVVFSYHTPTVSCQRGTLLKWGSELCDGVVDVSECTRCSLHGHGLSKIGSTLAGSIPSGVGRLLGGMKVSGGIWTAARMRELLRVRQAMFHALMDEADHVIALCHWVNDLLLRNGVSANKISVSRQGLDDLPFHPVAREARTPVQMAFLGRLDPTKGLDVLIEAFSLNPGLPINLDVFGIVQDDSAYARRLQSLASRDRRITFHPPIPSEGVLSRLANYDVLAVPSQCLETGPRVALEAFAAGIPVIGSNLGGIAELVSHGADGLLVDPRDASAWAASIRNICENPDVLSSLRAGIRPPRRMSDVALEMQTTYAALRAVAA